MKKILAIVLCVALAFSTVMVMSGCKSEEEKAAEALVDALEDLA